ncbi:uncharacterized protein LOC122859854 [Aphidius gifuensis]|uniref:uncharacterized protein LOC122859854 n=1 Tax=Aphidius gifuensis TaxID=684658 RepID=UPI001CDC0699|nr:uncharacterized protein LOC122859854 [Aphidius gifuensis]
MSAYASVNENYKFVLAIIDNFSKYAIAVPLKTKSAKDVTAAMKSVFLKGRYPKKHSHVDQGKEFYNSEFKNLMKKYNINMYSTYSTLKASYTPNWTTEVFTITKVLNTIPITYKLADYQDNNVEGCFYQEELSPVRYPDIYLVEKILKKRKNKVLVRWLGFDSEHDTWENESEL